MSGDEFGGLKEFAEKEKAAAATPPVTPPVETPPPEAKAPDVPRETPQVPAADAKPPETPAAVAAAKRKFALKGKVAGEERSWEIDEDDLDETKETEGRKKLIERFQKAEDYDRPGGALDQAASKRAQETYVRHMLEQGFFVRGADGKLYEAPQIVAYKKWNAEQAEKAKVPVPAAPPPAPAETPASKRVAELDAILDSGKGLDAKELREYTDLKADLAFDRREAAKVEAARKEREAAERQTTETTQQQQDAAQRRKDGDAEVQRGVDSIKELLRDPLTGQIDPDDLDVAARVMKTAVLESGDWNVGHAKIREHASRQQARLKSMADKIQKSATAPPPPPVHPASQPVNGNGKKEEGFDPERPFQDGDLARFTKTAAGR